MTFNELNSVEHFIIHNLTGVNLNNARAGVVREEPVGYAADLRVLQELGGLRNGNTFKVNCFNAKSPRSSLKKN